MAQATKNLEIDQDRVDNLRNFRKKLESLVLQLIFFQKAEGLSELALLQRRTGIRKQLSDAIEAEKSWSPDKRTDWIRYRLEACINQAQVRASTPYDIAQLK